MTRDWTVDDYGKYLIKTIIPQEIIPALLKTPALKEKLPATASAKESEAKDEKAAKAPAESGSSRRLVDSLLRTKPEPKD